MPRRWTRPLMMSSPATNRCAPYFPTLTVCRSRRCCRRRRGCGGGGGGRGGGWGRREGGGGWGGGGGGRGGMFAGGPLWRQSAARGPGGSEVCGCVGHV